MFFPPTSTHTYSSSSYSLLNVILIPNSIPPNLITHSISFNLYLISHLFTLSFFSYSIFIHILQVLFIFSVSHSHSNLAFSMLSSFLIYLFYYYSPYSSFHFLYFSLLFYFNTVFILYI